jgi:hypothetical protein
VVVEYNNAFNAGDTVASGPTANNIIAIRHTAIQAVGANSPSAHNGMMDEVQWINPCDGCALWRVGINGNVGDYQGAGGQRRPTIYAFDLTPGDPLYAGFLSMHAPANDGNEGIIRVGDCGLRACTDPGANYNIENLFSTVGGYKTNWDMSTATYHWQVSGASTTRMDMSSGGWDVQGNNGAGSSFFYGVTPSGFDLHLTTPSGDTRFQLFDLGFSMNQPLTVPSASVLASTTTNDLAYFDNTTGHLADSGILKGALVLLNAANQFDNSTQTFGLTGSGEVQIGNLGIVGINTSLVTRFTLNTSTGNIDGVSFSAGGTPGVTKTCTVLPTVVAGIITGC